VAKEVVEVTMTVTIPAFPRIINHVTILRRVGWLITDSASLVVNPVPEKAESAWKRAFFHSIPVIMRATAEALTTRKETKMANNAGARKYRPLMKSPPDSKTS
jgi:hypothetical protein